MVTFIDYFEKKDDGQQKVCGYFHFNIKIKVACCKIKSSDTA